MKSQGEWADALADRLGVSKAEAGRVIAGVAEVAAQALAEGKSVGLTGAFIVEPFERPARNGHNPKTGEKLTIAPKRKLRVRMSSKLAARMTP